MHIDQETLNLLLENRLEPEKREAVSDHILDCAACAKRFRMFRELQQKMQVPTTKKVIRFYLAAAVVLAMAAYPYLQNKKVPLHMQPLAVPTLAVAQTNTSSSLAILNQVQVVNMGAALAGWGHDHNVLDLVPNQK